METAAKIPVCFSMKRYKRRKKYQRLKRLITTNAADDYGENEMISMLEADQYHRRRGSTRKSKSMVIPKVSVRSNVEPLGKWRDAYEEMMLSFAGHFKQLNNGNVYLFKRIPKGNFQRLGN